VTSPNQCHQSVKFGDTKLYCDKY